MQLLAEKSPDAARRSRPIYRVFVSSTWLDLQPERTALMNALHRMEEMRFVGMEFFGNRPDDTHAASLDQVNACDVFVGVIGFRYGSGITEAEYRRAREIGLPCFLYFKDHASFQPSLTDGEPALAAKLEAFKAELMREHTVKPFPSPAELAASATGDLHNWVAARWVSVAAEPDRPSPGGTRPATAPDQDRVNLLRLVERIDHDWVKGVLEASLHHRVWLDLGLDWRDDAVEHPWDRIVVAPNRPIQTLATGDSIAQVFASAQHTLLVLGEPGAGKTTTLLELARDAIERVRQSGHDAAPVVLALSTWTSRHRDLMAWLVEELNVRYQVPKRIAQTWLTDGRLLLLLDGLDEVAETVRDRCVAQINAFAEEHCPSGLAVTCRVAEYAALGTRLHLRAAICLQPLSLAQVERYFAAAGPQLQPLRAALQQDAGLRELARTPLMLSVMTMAWHSAPASEVADLAKGGDSPEILRRRLFDAYVHAALRRRGKASTGHLPEQAIGWLAWLAQRMRESGQTLFVLEQLQPVWLVSRGRQLAYFLCTRVLAAFALTLPFLVERLPDSGRLQVLAAAGLAGVAFGATDFGLAQRPRERRGTQRFWILLLVLATLLVGWWTLQKLVGLPRSPVPTIYLIAAGFAFCADADVQTLDVKPAQSIRWSPRLAWQRGVDGLVGLMTFVFVLVAGVFCVSLFKYGWTVARQQVSLNARIFELLGATTVVAAIVWAWCRPARTLHNFARALALVVGCTGLADAACRDATVALALFAFVGGPAIVLGVFRGFESKMIDPTRPRTSGTWFWLRAPLEASMVVALVVVIGVMAWIYGARIPSTIKPTGALRMTFETAFLAATVAFLRFGGFTGIQHYVLRALLVRAGNLPPNAEAFFTSMVQGALMQKVGAGYRFVHALLLEHLARLAPNRRC